MIVLRKRSAMLLTRRLATYLAIDTDEEGAWRSAPGGRPPRPQRYETLASSRCTLPCASSHAFVTRFCTATMFVWCAITSAGA